MADKTGIEWTDATWNPTTGCDQVSPGCDNCYAMTLAPRLKAMRSPRYQLDGNPETSGPAFGFQMHADALDQPLRWTRPRRIFVNSMSDLFHSDMTTEFLAQAFAVMALAPQHTFQVLSKRPGVMRSVLSSQEFQDSVWAASVNPITGRILTDALPWPLPNVWLGTSVEDQKRADLRIPQLLATPAAVRFLSCEPLLGPVDLVQSINVEPLAAYHFEPGGIDWVIVGGESGPGARPMHPDWVRQLRNTCTRSEVAFHFKQWGSHDEHGTPMHKKAAGRILDGRTWDEFPQTVTA